MSTCRTENADGHPSNGIALKPLTVTVGAATKISGLGTTTVWKLIKERKLEAVHVGRRTLVTIRSLELLLTPKGDIASLPRRRGRPRKDLSDSSWYLDELASR